MLMFNQLDLRLKKRSEGLMLAWEGHAEVGGVGMCDAEDSLIWERGKKKEEVGRRRYLCSGMSKLFAYGIHSTHFLSLGRVIEHYDVVTCEWDPFITCCQVSSLKEGSSCHLYGR